MEVEVNPAFASAMKSERLPWLVRMHHRMRTAAFALLFVAIAMHIWDKSYGVAAWAALVAFYLVYPHVQFWRSAYSADPLRTEMDNLIMDALLVGVSIAALQFPLWISFAAVLGVLTDNTANKGIRGIWESILAFLLGVSVWVSMFGVKISAETAPHTALFCIVALTAYLMAVSVIGHARNVQLRATREKLKSREQELLESNALLLEHLSEISELQHQLQEQANRDSLTGLYNRRYLDSTLERELARCMRDGQALTIMMLDIDHFKRINDLYGHQAGDSMLVELGKLLSRMARASDVACRYGGEEFLVFMPSMTLEAGRLRAEQLRVDFAAMRVHFGEFTLHTTISIGIAVYPGHGTSADELIRAADLALYQAKQAGRDRVIVTAQLTDSIPNNLTFD